jgi:hypothetical protein
MTVFRPHQPINMLGLSVAPEPGAEINRQNASGASAAPVARLVPWRTGRRLSKSAGAVIAAGERTPHNSRGGRNSGRKKSLVITLATSGTAFCPCGFCRFLTSSR